MLDPMYKSEQFDTDLPAYPKVSVELWNTTLKAAKNRLKEGLPQRLVVGWKEMATQYEVMLVPLNNRWDELRMNGTTGDYTFVGIDRRGCYAFDMDRYQSAGYIQEKLNIGPPEATGMSLLFKVLTN